MIETIDIVGNVKIFNPLRLKYFISVINSLSFLKNNCKIWINVENGKDLIKPLENHLYKLGFKYVKISCDHGFYGDVYMKMLRQGSGEYVLNLEDDHFLQINSKDVFLKIINEAKKNNVEVIHATFFKMLLDHYKYIQPEFESEHNYGFRFNMKVFNALALDDNSIFCGNNCIFRRDYALKHWGKDYKSYRPHPFEEINFTEDKSLMIMILKTEILRPIDDDHGVENSCCIKNPDNTKWKDVFYKTRISSFYKWVLRFHIKNKLKEIPYIRRFIQ